RSARPPAASSDAANVTLYAWSTHCTDWPLADRSVPIDVRATAGPVTASGTITLASPTAVRVATVLTGRVLEEVPITSAETAMVRFLDLVSDTHTGANRPDATTRQGVSRCAHAPRTVAARPLPRPPSSPG